MTRNLLVLMGVSIFFVASLIISPTPTSASLAFNPNLILTDEEFTDYNSLNVGEIQAFLQRKGSTLAYKRFDDYQGINKTAAEIIWQAAQESKINPKVLLTTLQKEQSLIGSPVASQNQYDKAMGYRCPDGALCAPGAAGFGKQVDGAAWQFRQYLDKPSSWNYQRFKTSLVDGSSVTPLSNATAGLYNYTPHFSGNQSFWRLWISYWGKDYPDGSLVKSSDSPAVWLLQNGTRRLITSYAILVSRYNPKAILPITSADLNKYQQIAPVKFENYSLLAAPDGKVYLLIDDHLRHVASEEVFRAIGFNWDEIQNATADDIAAYTIGEPIMQADGYPTGALLQTTSSPAVWYVENSVRHPIVARDILDIRFDDKIVTKVSRDRLEAFSIGEPATLPDGILVQQAGDPSVYVISGGSRRWIVTEEAFVKFGYTWNNIRSISPEALSVHPLGDNLE